MTLEQQIEETQKQLSALQKKLEKSKKLELRYGKGYVLSTYTEPNMEQTYRNSKAVARGSFRATKELAEIADKNMVTRNRLEAYVHQIQGDGNGDYSIAIYDGVYKWVHTINGSKRVGAVYMQKETAEILCEALNKGEICLWLQWK